MSQMDAKIVIDQEHLNEPTTDYAHLLLRPYPERLIKPVILKDGTHSVFRPIKPEDEPLWLEMLSSCSKESIYSRFRHDFHFDSHEVATQFCYIDYDREIGIVAEIDFEGRKRLIGVGRLIADPDLEMAEYAVLVADQWQHRELGFALTEYCVEIAKNAGVKRVVAETTRDNKPMVTVFKKLGFKIHYDDDGSVSAVRELD